ncbi:MAG TPA: Ig-like domain-containing protein [Vicinamibacterales bacterium]|nr:Ig-like domain-containing protein [Vicinamibacterales bacterium]
MPSSITVTGFNGPLVVGGAVQLTATLISSDGSTRPVTTEAVWQSSNVAIATVSNTGLVLAVGLGTVEIRATFQGRTGSGSLSVADQGPPPPGLSCGVERWSVKTLSDSAATSVNVAQVQATTIRALNQQPAHCSGLPSARTFSQEFQVYEVLGRITFVRLEDDRDYHVALADPADPAFSIVTEVADPVCQGLITSPFFTTLSGARSQFDNFRGGRATSLLVGEIVRVRGVGFYDFNHNQTGRSQSCIELHPLLGFERGQ